MRTQGTPTTLKQAIMNGLKEATSIAPVKGEADHLNAILIQTRQLELIELHILDFFRQKFGVAYLEAAEVEGSTMTILDRLSNATGVKKS